MFFFTLIFVHLFSLLVQAKFYRPYQFNQYKAGLSPHYEQGKPTSRHKNHCAYVTERAVTFTMQDGASPYVKAEYNKCSWGQKCPTLLYRLMYKPLYKVAHKTVTELEWRCCPGFSGYDCMDGHQIYQPPMRMLPPFDGTNFKGPQSKAPTLKGPAQANSWSQPKGPPTGGFNSYPMTHFGPPGSSSYPDTSFEPYPSETQPEPDHQEPHLAESHQEHEHHQGPDAVPAPLTAEEHQGHETSDVLLNKENEERMNQMEEDMRRLSQGLETLRGTVAGLEDRLRASLREDANRMLSALLSAAPAPLPAPATASNPSIVGFVEIPGGHLDTGGLDGSRVFPDLAELNGRVDELRAELQAKTAELQQLKATVVGHDGVLKKISREVEMSVEDAEQNETTLKIKKELVNIQTQINDLKVTESCCDGTTGLAERVEQLETFVANLNRSQGHLKVELSAHKDHIEGMLEGRLTYVESKLNLTGKTTSDHSGRRNSVLDNIRPGPGLEAKIDNKLRALEDRLLSALEELTNATAPALLEGHAVPTLETELESLRGRLELDVDRVKKHLNALEILCTSSCSSDQTSGLQGDSAGPNQEPGRGLSEVLHMQDDRLNRLNVTLQSIIDKAKPAEHAASPIETELIVLKFNVRTFNRSLTGLKDTLGTVVHQVDQANSSWHEREERLAQQIKGVVQLVGHQASMLGAGERRLARLKGELQEMKRRLGEEVRGCRSTAMGVKKEVTEVGGRVANVEDQCKGLSYLAEDLERIREELEKQSNGLLHQINGTLSIHAQQLSELKGELKNCSLKLEPTQSSETEADARRGDTFSLT